MKWILKIDTKLDVKKNSALQVKVGFIFFPFAHLSLVEKRGFLLPLHCIFSMLDQ